VQICYELKKNHFNDKFIDIFMNCKVILKSFNIDTCRNGDCIQPHVDHRGEIAINKLIIKKNNHKICRNCKFIYMCTYIMNIPFILKLHKNSISLKNK